MWFHGNVPNFWERFHEKYLCYLACKKVKLNIFGSNQTKFFIQPNNYEISLFKKRTVVDFLSHRLKANPAEFNFR